MLVSIAARYWLYWLLAKWMPEPNTDACRRHWRLAGRLLVSVIYTVVSGAPCLIWVVSSAAHPQDPEENDAREWLIGTSSLGETLLWAWCGVSAAVALGYLLLTLFLPYRVSAVALRRLVLYARLVSPPPSIEVAPYPECVTCCSTCCCCCCCWCCSCCGMSAGLRPYDLKRDPPPGRFDTETTFPSTANPAASAAPDPVPAIAIATSAVAVSAVPAAPAPLHADAAANTAALQTGEPLGHVLSAPTRGDAPLTSDEKTIRVTQQSSQSNAVTSPTASEPQSRAAVAVGTPVPVARTGVIGTPSLRAGAGQTAPTIDEKTEASGSANDHDQKDEKKNKKKERRERADTTNTQETCEMKLSKYAFEMRELLHIATRIRRVLAAAYFVMMIVAGADTRETSAFMQWHALPLVCVFQVLTYDSLLFDTMMVIDDLGSRSETRPLRKPFIAMRNVVYPKLPLLWYTHVATVKALIDELDTNANDNDDDDNPKIGRWKVPYTAMFSESLIQDQRARDCTIRRSPCQREARHEPKYWLDDLERLENMGLIKLHNRETDAVRVPRHTPVRSS